jgi:glycine/D-amino acid oxidase-like deaminating enzyme
MSRDSNSDVLIVGAGPTGLVLALWLTRLGVRVRIIDKTSEPGTTSRALAVQARTLELYRQVGLADAVVARGRKMTAVSRARCLRGYGRGRQSVSLRADQTELVASEEMAAGVRANLRRADGTINACEATYLAGCAARTPPCARPWRSVFRVAPTTISPRQRRRSRGPGGVQRAGIAAPRFSVASGHESCGSAAQRRLPRAT